MPTVIQTKVFVGTVEMSNPASLIQFTDTLWADVNTFLATLPVSDVLDVRTEIEALPSPYGTVSLVSYQVMVVHLLH